MTRPVALVVGAIVALALVAELVALPIGSRVLSTSLGRCVAHDGLEVEEARRPLLPRLATGRPRDVTVAVEGLHVGDLRVAVVRVTMPELHLPWAIGQRSGPAEAVLELDATEGDLERWLRDAAPLGLAPTVTLAPDRVTLGVEGLPFRVSLRVAVVDGVLTLQPVGGDRGWWASLGIAATLPLPEGVRVDRVVVDEGRLRATVRLDDVAGLTDGGRCEGPLAPAAGAAAGGASGPSRHVG